MSAPNNTRGRLRSASASASAHAKPPMALRNRGNIGKGNPSVAAKRSTAKASNNDDIYVISSSDDEEIQITAGPSRSKGKVGATKQAKVAKAPAETGDSLAAAMRVELEQLRAALESEKAVRSQLTATTEEQAKELAELRAQGDGKAQNSIEALRNTLECPVCSELLQKPFALNPCGHTFCAQCLHNWFSRDGVVKDCPSCRTIVNSPPVRMYLIKSIVDILKVEGDPKTPARPGNGRPEEDAALWAGLFPAAGGAAQLANAPAPALIAAPPIPAPVFAPAPVAQLAVPANQPNLIVRAGAVPVGNAWTIPTYRPEPIFQRYTNQQLEGLNDWQRSLYRRGASSGMMHKFNMRYADDQGITGDLGPHHLHFGWVINPTWFDKDVEDLEQDVQIEIIEHPERYQFQGGCVFRLLPRDL